LAPLILEPVGENSLVVGKRQLGKLSRSKQSDLADFVTYRKLATDVSRHENGKHDRIVRFRIEAEQARDLNLEAGFLTDFANHCIINGLASVYVSRGERPVTETWVDSPPAEYKAAFDRDNSHRNELWVLVVDESAAWAGWAFATGLHPPD